MLGGLKCSISYRRLLSRDCPAVTSTPKHTHPDGESKGLGGSGQVG